MIKDKNYYMSIDYDIILTKLSDDEGGGYMAYYKDINTIMGDGETQEEAIKDVKSAFECYVNVSLKNKEAIIEPIDLEKSKRINVSLTNRRILGLDNIAKKLNTDRSKVISKLTDMLLDGQINLKMN